MSTWFPLGARRAIRLDDLNDPRPGGRAAPLEGKKRRGLRHVDKWCYVLELNY